MKKARHAASRVTGADYGYYKPFYRVHIDQVPFSLDGTARTTFVDVKVADGAVISGIPGQDKRFGACQIAFHGDPDKKQFKLESLGGFIFSAP